MTLQAFILVFCSVSLSALGQTFFKLGVSALNFGADSSTASKALSMLLSHWVLAGLAAYGVGTLLWLFALRQLDLSLAYPFVAMSFIMVAGSGILFLGEPLTSGKVLGIALIVSGLCVMAFGK